MKENRFQEDTQLIILETQKRDDLDKNRMLVVDMKVR